MNAYLYEYCCSVEVTTDINNKKATSKNYDSLIKSRIALKQRFVSELTMLGEVWCVPTTLTTEDDSVGKFRSTCAKVIVFPLLGGLATDHYDIIT